MSRKSPSDPLERIWKKIRADVDRIKREAVQELAAKGKLPHQRRRNPAPEIVGAKAKRGDLMLFPVVRRATYVHGPTERETEYELAHVLGIHRDGSVAVYRVGGQSYDMKGAPSKLWLMHAEQLNESPNNILYAYIKRHEWDRAFKSFDEAKAWLARYRK